IADGILLTSLPETPNTSCRPRERYPPDGAFLLIRVVHCSSPSIIRAGMLSCTLFGEVAEQVRALPPPLAPDVGAVRLGCGERWLCCLSVPTSQQDDPASRQAEPERCHEGHHLVLCYPSEDAARGEILLLLRSKPQTAYKVPSSQNRAISHA